jgi:hypothetical protein
VGLVLDKLSDDLRTDWHDRFREMTRDFEQDMAHFSYMRALEETWHIQDSPIQVPPGGAQWSEEEEAKFKEDLKSLFVRTFIEYAQKLEKILGRHYKVLVDRLIDDFELLVDEAATVIRRDPDRVTLPVEMLSGEESDDEQARIDRSLLLYHRSMEDLQRIQQQLDESLNSRN